jgi:hypothetical protein
MTQRENSKKIANYNNNKNETELKINGDIKHSTAKKSLVAKIDSPQFQNVPAIVIVDIDEVSNNNNNDDNDDRHSFHQDQVDLFIDE